MNLPELIFDLDGTLADTALLTEAAFKKILPKLKVPQPPLETIRAAVGYQNPEFYFHVFPNAPEEIVNRIGELTEDEEQRLLPYFKRDLLFPGVRATLQVLRGLGAVMHIASTGSETHVYSILNKCGIKDFFKKILCDRPHKAGMVAEIIAGRDASGFFFIGDMRKDVEAARANGVVSIGASYGYCKNNAGFDKYIDSPEKLPIIIIERGIGRK